MVSRKQNESFTYRNQLDRFSMLAISSVQPYHGNISHGCSCNLTRLGLTSRRTCGILSVSAKVASWARYGRCSRHASFLGWQMNKKLKEKEWTVYFEPSSSHYCDIAYANKDWNRSIRFKCAEHYHQFTELLKEAGYVYIDLSFLIIDGLIKPSSIFSV